MSADRSHKNVIVVAVACLVISIFVLDVFTPLGYAVWILYLYPLILSSRVSFKQAPLVVAALGSVLTVVGTFLSPPGVPLEYVAVLRAAGIASFWLLGGALAKTETPRPANPRWLTVPIAVSVMAALLLLAGSMSLTVILSAELTKSQQQVVRAESVLTVFSQIDSAILQAESSQRGYLLMEGAAHLESYKNAVHKISSLQANLRERMAGNPVQLRRMDDLDRHIAEKVDELEATMRLFQQLKVQAAPRLVESGSGVHAMEAIGLALAQMEQEERAMLAISLQRADQTRMWVLAAATFSALFQVALVAAVIVLLKRRLQVKELESGLRELETIHYHRGLLQTFIENTPAAVAMLDRDFRYLYVSRRWLEDYALGARNIIGQSHYEVFPELREKPEWQDIHRRCLEGAVERCEEEAFVRADGSRAWLRWEVRPWREQTGVIGGILLFTENITARKQAEEVLRQSHGLLEEAVRERTAELEQAMVFLRKEIEAHTQAQASLRKAAAEIEDLYDNAPCGYHSLDEQGVIVRVNQTELAWLGRTREQVLGKPVSDFMTPASADQFRSAYAAFREQGRVRDAEYELVRQDGSLLSVLVNADVIRDSDGRFVMSRSTMVDISGRKQADEARRRLAAIVESSDDAIIGTTLDGIITSWNRGAEQLYGYQAQETMGQPVTMLIPSDCANEEAHMIARVAAGEHVSHFETIRIKKNGVRIDVSVTISPVRDEHGGIVGISKIVRDLSEIRQAEKRFVGLLESAPEAIVIIGGDGRIAVANRQTERLFGYRREELLGQPVEVLMPERFRAMHGGHRNRFFSAPQERPMGMGGQLWAVRKDGQEFPVEISLNPTPSDAGFMVMASIRDITERRQAEEALRRAHAFLDSIIENIPNMIFVKEAKELRFIRFNRAGEELLGCRREELIGKTDYDLFPTEEADFFTAKDREVLESGHLLDIAEETIQTRHHGVRTLHTKKIPILGSDGQPEYLLGISEDITERKAAEKELQERGLRLEEANKELEAFSYSVSHDLRAPLRSLNGFSLALLEDCAAKLNVQERDHLHRIRSASQRMDHLIEALLRLSRAARQDFRPEPINLSALASSCAEELSKAWPDRRVDVEIEPGLRVHGDRRLIRIVLDNLLGNAWKFTAKRDQAKIAVGSLPCDGATAFFVRDNGAGFDMAFEEKLFGAFQRLHGSQEFAGTGIGLATVKRIVTRHGGRVWAEGVENQGATFYFTLGE